MIQNQSQCQRIDKIWNNQNGIQKINTDHDIDLKVKTQEARNNGYPQTFHFTPEEILFLEDSLQVCYRKSASQPQIAYQPQKINLDLNKQSEVSSKFASQQSTVRKILLQTDRTEPYAQKSDQNSQIQSLDLRIKKLEGELIKKIRRTLQLTENQQMRKSYDNYYAEGLSKKTNFEIKKQSAEQPLQLQHNVAKLTKTLKKTVFKNPKKQNQDHQQKKKLFPAEYLSTPFYKSKFQEITTKKKIKCKLKRKQSEKNLCSRVTNKKSINFRQFEQNEKFIRQLTQRIHRNKSQLSKRQFQELQNQLELIKLIKSMENKIMSSMNRKLLPVKHS